MPLTPSLLETKRQLFGMFGHRGGAGQKHRGAKLLAPRRGLERAVFDPGEAGVAQAFARPLHHEVEQAAAGESPGRTKDLSG